MHVQFQVIDSNGGERWVVELPGASVGAVQDLRLRRVGPLQTKLKRLVRYDSRLRDSRPRLDQSASYKNDRSLAWQQMVVRNAAEMGRYFR